MPPTNEVDVEAGRLAPVRRVFSRPINDVSRALRAASYPLRGIWYFLRRPEFYPLFAGRLLPLSIISFLVYVLLFTFTFPLQLAFLAIFHGWAGAIINTTILVLGEGLVIIQALFEGFFVDEARVDVFDATLIDKGYLDLLVRQRVIFLDAPNPVKMLGKPTRRAEYQPWSLVQIVEMIFFLPLNLIPVVGVPAFIMITGTRLGKLSHHRWFTLKGMTKKEIKRELNLRSWEYVWFGTVAMVLNLIPILSFFFLLTSAAGAALWVAKIQDETRPVPEPPLTPAEHIARMRSGMGLTGPQDNMEAYHDDEV
ncbi:outer spore wall protein RRT8 [Rhypophila decipiens]